MISFKKAVTISFFVQHWCQVNDCLHNKLEQFLWPFLIFYSSHTLSKITMLQSWELKAKNDNCIVRYFIIVPKSFIDLIQELYIHVHYLISLGIWHFSFFTLLFLVWFKYCQVLNFKNIDYQLIYHRCDLNYNRLIQGIIIPTYF